LHAGGTPDSKSIDGASPSIAREGVVALWKWRCAMAVFAVTTEKGPSWDRSRQIREQREWPEHAAFADELVEQGIILLGGPIGGGSADDVALLMVEAQNEPEIRSIFNADPWVFSGVLAIKDARPWTLWLDSRGKKPE
jgi:uncharacterized protein